MVAVALIASLLAAPAAADADIDRISGENRFATSVAVSEAAFDDPDVVWVATGQAFPDALAAGAAAATTGAPVLTTPSAALADEVRDELTRLDPDVVRVAGGSGAVSAATVAAIADAVPDADIERFAGDGRYDTAADVLAATFPRGVDTIYLATGREFADALAAVPAAAADNAGLLLTDPDVLLPEVEAALADAAPSELIVVGGTGAISNAVASAAADAAGGADTERIAGEGRFETGALLAERAGPGDQILVASGLDFADALAAGPAAAELGTAVVLTADTLLPEPSFDLVADIAPAAITVIGGTAAISDAVVEALRAAAAGDDPPVDDEPTRVAYSRFTATDGPRDSSVRSIGLDGSGDAVVVAGSTGAAVELRDTASDGAMVIERSNGTPGPGNDASLAILDASGNEVGTWPQGGGCSATAAAFSPDGETLMAACDRNPDSDIVIAPIDRSGADVGPASQVSVLFESFSWRADGAEVAFSAALELGADAVYTRTVSSADLRTVVDNAQSASFSPTGSALAVTRGDEIVLVEGGSETVLTADAVTFGFAPPVWTPDATAVVIGVERGGESSLLHLSRSGDETILHSGPNSLTAAAATSTEVVVEELVTSELGPPQSRLAVASLDGGGLRILTDVPNAVDVGPALLP